MQDDSNMQGVSADTDRATAAEPVVSALRDGIPDALVIRPDHKGNFDEIVARFVGGTVHVETLTNKTCYVGFYWDDGRILQWYISSKKKLEYFHAEDRRGPAPNRRTTMTLADRIEAADGPSRELDWEIFCLMQPDSLPYYELEMAKTKAKAEKNGTWAVCPDAIIQRQRSLFTPSYTSSLDAAMTLVQEGCSLSFEGCTFIKCDSGEWRQAVTNGPAHQLSQRLILPTAATPALALCAAALRAYEQDQGDTQ